MSEVVKKNEIPSQEAVAGSELEERHPSLETLAAYKDGQLAGNEAEEVERHLIDCDECVGILVLDDSEPTQEDSNLVDFEKERNWRAIRAEIRAERAEVKLEEAKRKLSDTEAVVWNLKNNIARQKRAGWRNAVAAMLLCAIPLGTVAARMSSKADMLGEEVASLTSPQVNNGLVILPPLRRQADTTQELMVETELFTLAIPAHGKPGDTFRIRIEDATGMEVWTGGGFRAVGATTTLGLSRGFLSAGKYKICVSPDSAGAQDTVDYSIELRYL